MTDLIDWVDFAKIHPNMILNDDPNLFHVLKENEGASQHAWCRSQHPCEIIF